MSALLCLFWAVYVFHHSSAFWAWLLIVSLSWNSIQVFHKSQGVSQTMAYSLTTPKPLSEAQRLCIVKQRYLLMQLFNKPWTFLTASYPLTPDIKMSSLGHITRCRGEVREVLLPIIMCTQLNSVKVNYQSSVFTSTHKIQTEDVWIPRIKE